MYPERVEALILDSPTFLEIQPHEFFVRQVMNSWNLLDEQCPKISGCSAGTGGTRAIMMELYERLENEPIAISMNHPYTGAPLPFLLEGDTMIAAISEGLYGTEVLDDLPAILADLRASNTASLQPYLEQWVSFMLSVDFSDLSMVSHKCFEEIPFTDAAAMRAELGNLPAGYIRNYAEFWLDAENFCSAMGVEAGPDFMGETKGSNVPTLILQGDLDTVTPTHLTDSQLSKFPNSLPLYFELAHDVLGSTACAEIYGARFVATKSLVFEDYDCTFGK